MIKYFIENSNGEWLTPPGEYRGSCWTRDPFKAWTFDKQKIEIGMNFIDLRGPGGAVIIWMTNEGVFGPGYHLSEQEFQRAVGQTGPGSCFHISSTSKQSFYDTFTYGQSIVKTTWGMQRDYSPDNYGGYKGPDED